MSSTVLYYRIFDGEFNTLRRTCCTDVNGNPGHGTHSGRSESTDVKPGMVCGNHGTDGTTSGNYRNRFDSTTSEDQPSCNTDNDDDVIFVSCEVPDKKRVQHSSSSYINYDNNDHRCSQLAVEVNPICGQQQKLSVHMDAHTYSTDGQCSVKRKLQDSWSISPSKSLPGGKVYLMKKCHKQKASSDKPMDTSVGSKTRLNLTGDVSSTHIKGDNSPQAPSWSTFLASDSLPDLTL